MIGLILIIIGIVLVVDQLYIIIPGCGIGGFLGDLSALDPTGDLLHHYMIGIFLIVLGAIVFYKESATVMRRKR